MRMQTFSTSEGLTYRDKIGRVVRQSPGGFFKLQASFEKLKA